MKNYFDALLELLRQYVEVSINNRSEIAKINNNGDMSQIAKEREVNKLKEKALKLSEDCIKQASLAAEASIKSILLTCIMIFYSRWMRL